MIDERGYRCFVWVFFIVCALAPFGALKVCEIIKYIYQHVQWVP